MREKHQIKVLDKADSEGLALILIRAGYTVQIVPLKVNGRTKSFEVRYEQTERGVEE